jgi:uncharacterized protein
MRTIGRVSKVVLSGLALATAGPAVAQFSDSYTFLKAVRDSDGTKAMELLDKTGNPVLNTRDPSTGETALHIVIKQHNDTWLAFLLNKGAQTDLRDRDGNTPLHLAALAADGQAVGYLLAAKAKVDATNNSGETPLILAVHARDVAVVRQLIAAGANPKINDTIAGKSAADYAAEDSRGQVIAKLLAEAKPAPAKVLSGPVR